MKNEIVVAKDLAQTYKDLPQDLQDRVTDLIDSLNGDGWKDSQIVAPDNSPGGGLRARLSGDLRLLFRYVPEMKTIIVTDIAAMREHKLAAAS